MLILVSGASGIIGAPLCEFLKQQGHSIVALTRKPSLPNSILWDPERGKVAKEELEGFDAVIHLAGERLAIGRWGRAKKEKILFSRTVGTWFLSQILANLIQPPKVFISASAIGYYGDRGEEILTEESAPGEGFLATVCKEWEKATLAIENRGTRTLRARFGMVLGPRGGALQSMLLPFKFGFGARIGSGNQWVSWIALADLIRAIEHLLLNESLEGAVNLVSPHPLRQKEFVQALASHLHRPAFFVLPKWLVRLLFGAAAGEMLLASSRVQPEKLEASRFAFRYPLLMDALKAALH